MLKGWIRKLNPVRLLRYGLTGIALNVFLYLLFLVSVHFGQPPLAVSIACYVLGVCLSYLINRSWVFSSPNRHLQDIPRFLAAYLVGLSVNALSMFVLLMFLGPAIAQLVTIVVAAGTIYGLLHILQFGAKGHEDAFDDK